MENAGGSPDLQPQSPEYRAVAERIKLEKPVSVVGMGYPVGILETHSSDAVCKLWNSSWKRTNLKTPGVLNPTRADEHCPRRWFLVPLSPRASSSC
ncbi:hypothetical protein RHGRI_007750 [Rhododendron griersonianum]|uniref:Uncharacterized protein n=1 Tax=Rhododendron griersonianum TaxID=479676 RepID=A0AAV6KYR9_9ERIC|nr:hypothetical protein RHGRI_007750 [Rhododendron griersonianum]